VQLCVHPLNGPFQIGGFVLSHSKSLMLLEGTCIIAGSLEKVRQLISPGDRQVDSKRL